MIAYPEDWEKAGVTIIVADVKKELLDILYEIDCDCLAFSGGLDSSLLLYYMCEIFGGVRVFTIGKEETHPDIMFAEKVVSHYRKVFDTVIEHKIYCPTKEEIEQENKVGENFPGDKVVRLFYRFVSLHTGDIIAGDGVDEFMCGYYAHRDNPCEKTYYEYLRKLQTQQLIPLNKNSGRVRVYLPYIDRKIIFLLSQIPLADKVDSERRKKFMLKLAEGKVPDEVILRRKYGFCDAFVRK